MNDTRILSRTDASGLATVTLNRPELHNAFDDRLVAALKEELCRLEADDRVRVLLLCGSGKNFCAGADLAWMRRMAGYGFEENVADAAALAELFRQLDRFRKPTVALVQGAAFGGGVGLVACCDIAVCTADASFCLSETRLGLIPVLISPYVVPAIGARAARRYFLSAEPFGADEALRLGLVHEVAQGELAPVAERITAALLRCGPNAMAAAKEQVARVAQGPIDPAFIDDTVHRIARIRASEEGKEGLSAFLEKRKPSWVKG